MSAAGYLLVSSYALSLALGMTQLLLPLYGYHLGLSSAAIGSLIALPVVAQFPLRIGGGLAADRWGERALLMAGYATMIVAGLLFSTAGSYPVLLTAQLISVVSRSAFRVGTVSLASKLGGDINVRIGRLNATINAGQISGIVLGGVLLQHLGFHLAFQGVTLTGALAVLFSFGLPPRRTAETTMPSITQGFTSVLRNRMMYFSMLCAFVGAIPVGLIGSFYPIYLAEVGVSSGLMGPLVSLRSAGTLTASVVLARLVTRERRLLMTIAAIAAVGLSLFLTPLFPHVAALAVFLAGLGMASGVLQLLNQLIASDNSTEATRGSAIGLSGLGWTASHVVSPTIFGLLADRYGLAMTFYIGGIALFIVTACAPILYRWALKGQPPMSVAAERDLSH